MLSDLFHIVASMCIAQCTPYLLYLKLGMLSRSRDESRRQVDCLLSYVYQWQTW